MNIPRLILRKLREECVGRPNAIKRKELLHWLMIQGVYEEKWNDSADREMRAIIETMPVICSCESGYYVAREGEEGEADVAYAILYIRKKAMPLLKKIRDKKRSYPQYYGSEGQGELPYENDSVKGSKGEVTEWIRGDKYW